MLSCEMNLLMVVIDPLMSTRHGDFPVVPFLLLPTSSPS
jgi:hypothetical protein